TGFGLLLVPAAVGGIIGSGIAPRLRDQPLRRVLTIAVVVAGLTGIAISVSSNAVVVGGLLAAQYAAILVWNVLTLALRQRLIPDELLGRVGSSYRFLVFVGMPIGAAIGGLFASVVGLRETFALSGLIIVAAAFFLPTAVKASPTPPVEPPAPPQPLPPPRLDSPSLLPPGTTEPAGLRLPPPETPRVGPPLPPPEPPGRPTPPSRTPQRRRSRRPRRRQRNKR
ncbi:MAG: MFS transporter, partial [Actinomycetota bacterium]